MSLQQFFQPQHKRSTRMCELEFEYFNGRAEHEVTLAYVVATNETQAILDLKSEILLHHCELKSVTGLPRRIEAIDFDDYVHTRWPDHIKSLVSKDMIRDHEHTVYVLPPIRLMD